MVKTNGKHCEVRQEEEYDDEDIKVGLTYVDYEGASRCAITRMLVGDACLLLCGYVALQQVVQKVWRVKVL